MRNSRVRVRFFVQAMTISLTFQITIGSVAPPSKPGNNNEKLSPFNPEPVEDMSNDFFKQKEGWWKDPFAMFEDDESMIDKNRDISTDSSCQKSLQQHKLGSIIEPEGRTRENSPFLHAQPVIQYPTEQVTQAHVLPTQDGQTPPDVAQGSIEAPFGSRDSAVDSSSSSISTDHETRHTHHDSINPFLNQAISAPVEPSLLHLDDQTKESKVVGIIWKAVPFVQVLLSFAFVKVAQPLMERLGNRHKYQEFTNHQADDRYPSFSESVNDRSYSSYRHHETMTRGGGSPNSNWFRRTFGEPKTSLEVLPPARELVDQVEYLQRELSMVKSEKDAMEKEYEKASWQVS
jgi:hypothetical protein